MTTARYLNPTRLTIIALAFTLLGCKNTSEVKLEMVNKEIYFLDSVADNRRMYFKDKAEKKRAQNIVSYRLTNTTDKKLLFVFNKIEIQPSTVISPTTFYYGYIGFTIHDKNKKVRKFYPVMPMSDKMAPLYGCKFHELYKKRSIYANLGVTEDKVQDFDNFLNNSIVIYPGETRTFKGLFYLPIITERDSLTEEGSLSYYDLDESDSFELFYYCKAGALKNSLPQYVKDDLDSNNIEIFDGELKASPVKLKKR